MTGGENAGGSGAEEAVMSRPSKGILAAVLILAWMVALAGPTSAQEQLIAEVTIETTSDVAYVANEAILDVVKDVLKVGEPYTEEKATEACELVMRMGYFDDVTTSIEQVPKGVRVVITVVEKRRIKHLMFAGNTVVTDEELRGVILTQPGHVVDPRAIKRDVRRIEDHYKSRGYIAHVSDAGVDRFGVLTFVIDEARIEDVVIEGLRHTKESYVRKVLDLEPGELFQENRVASNITNVSALGIFDKVETSIRPGQDDPIKGVIVVVSVEEARTGRASAALGYSNLDKLVVMLMGAETNLRGRGERVSVTLELGGRESYEFSFSEPYLRPDGTTFEINLFDTERKRRFVGGAAVSTADDEFEDRRTGGNFTVTKPLAKARYLSLRFRSEQVSSSYFQATAALPPAWGIISPTARGPRKRAANLPGGGDGATPPSDNPDLLPDNPGPGDIVGPIWVAAPLHPGGGLASVTLGLSDDRRNIRADPTAGSYSGVSYEQAGGFLGGEEEFGKLSLEHRRYFPVGKKLSLPNTPHKGPVVAARVSGGVALGHAPLFESFTVGGANSLRGYDADRWRGENLLLLNVEYRHPITDNLTAVGFVDAGDAWGGEFQTVVPGFIITAEDQDFELHAGVGVGLRVKTPLGPIRLDMGFGEEGSQAHFSFGHTF